MIAKYFFKTKEGTEAKKISMILRLDATEQDKFTGKGGLEKISDLAVLKKDGYLLKDKLTFGDKTATYIFNGYLSELDHIRIRLEKDLRFKSELRSTYEVPTFAELLAKQHDASSAGKIILRIDKARKLANQQRGKLWTTYRAPKDNTLESFDEAVGCCMDLEIEFKKNNNVAVVHGYKSEIDILRCNLSCEVEIRNFLSYDTLLLRSNAFMK